MTRQKSLKTRVRARMGKTGESYTAARRHTLGKTAAPAHGTAATQVRAQQVDDDAVRQRTGRDRDEWFSVLDQWGATQRTHTEIARWLRQEHQVGNWWAQTVTVAYEQARGMRVPGQKSDGTFSAGGSKTVAVPVDRLYEAFADASVRERWLPGVKLTVTTAVAPKSFRAGWEEGPTRIAVGFVEKGDAKAMVGLRHERLADADEAARMKAFWHDSLAALPQLLEG
jgi:hypothetical protein